MSQGNWSGGPPGGGWGNGGPAGAPLGGSEYGPPGGAGHGPPGGAPPGGYWPPGGAPPGIYSPPGGGGYGPMGPQVRYSDVPWYRQNGINSAFVLAGFFCFPPLLWATCVIVLKGPVYLDAYDEQGRLKMWGPANKVVAVILLALQVVAVAVRLTL